MARFIPGVTASTPSAQHADSLTDLTRLLSRLQQTILRADAEREARLRASEFEREKAQANIKNARSLLTSLEQDALGVKINMRRQDLQTDLNRKRELLDQITERLNDISEIAAAESNHGGGEDEGDSDASDVDDILAEIITMTPSESFDSGKSVATDEPDQDATALPAEIIPLDMPAPPSPSIAQKLPQDQTDAPSSSNDPNNSTSTNNTPTQTLRSRPNRGSSSQPPPSSTLAQTSSSSHLPSPTKPAHKSTTTTATTIATTEAILDHQRAEQDQLSESMLRLARNLKLSSQALSSSLDEDKELVSRAGDGMTKTGEGMDAVTRRMGALQRMTEGKGYWGRLRLYGMVYGLMVVLVLVVFVLPKLRF